MAPASPSAFQANLWTPAMTRMPTRPAASKSAKPPTASLVRYPTMKAPSVPLSSQATIELLGIAARAKNPIGNAKTKKRKTATNDRDARRRPAVALENWRNFRGITPCGGAKLSQSGNMR